MWRPDADWHAHKTPLILETGNMPWQAVPPLIIIGGAFALAGAGLTGVDYLTYGKVRQYLIMGLIY